jgi:tetratricopeptide (TPR) repeat protein
LNNHPDSIDALLQLSNLRILRCRDDEAMKQMNKIFEYIMNLIENNINNEIPPSADIISNLAKNFSELKVYDKAIKLYDLLLKINDEDVIVKYIYFSWKFGIWLHLIIFKSGITKLHINV